MQVSLPPQLESMLNKHVVSGRYGSKDALISEALRLWEQTEQERQIKLKHLKKAINDGIASGAPIPWNTDTILKKAKRKK